MKINLRNDPTLRRGQSAATLAEVCISVAVMAVMFVSLYGGMTNGFVFTRLARENLRGTQIILERLEGVRLYTWNQINYSNMIPTTFTNYYYPLGTNNASKGIAYYGTMVFSNADSSNLSPSPAYRDSMRVAYVSVTWTNGGIQRNRKMSTNISKNGVQNYVYND